MRVLQLTDALTLGGVERVVVDLSNELAHMGHEVAVAARAGPLWKQLRDVECFELSGPPQPGLCALLQTTASIRRVIITFKPQIIAVHQRRLALVANVVTANKAAKVIEYVHSTFDDHRWISFRSPALVAVGSSVQKQLLDVYRRPASRVFRVPCGVRDPGDLYLRTPDRTSGLKFIGVGRLVPEKDPGYFAELIEALCGLGIRVEATWFGDGPLQEEVQSRWPNVHWAGAVNNVPERIWQSDGLFITSRQEGLPLVVLEALAVGRAVLSRDVGSCLDAVRDDVNGIVWAADSSPEDVARLLDIRLNLRAPMESRDKLLQFGKEGRRAFEQSFEIGRMAEKTAELYGSVLAR